MATDLEARLELLEAERAITRTLHRYAHSIDYGDEEGWVDCFTEDGVFDVRSRHAHQLKRLITGREELRAFIARHTRAPELWHKHLLIEPVIDVDGDTASCVSYLAVVMEHEDVPVLARHFLRRSADRFGVGTLRLPDDLDARLLAWRWPGNVRELENTLESLVALSADGELDLAMLPSAARPEPSGAGLKERVEAYERGLVVEALRAAKGNRSEAARRLQVSRVTLLDKLKKHGLGEE